MAYLDKQRSQNRTATIIATIGIEALAIIAVVKGLDVAFLPREVVPPLVGEQIPLDPPPPPEPKAEPKMQPSFAPDRSVAPPYDAKAWTSPALPDPVPLPVPTGSPLPIPTADPIPLPAPAMPRLARPLGNPAGWVSTNDYPARDLREGNQGTTRFELTVGTDGRVAACTITRSSGFAGLDQATCDALTRRARFMPATDENGAKAVGRFSSSIRWVIPD